MIARPTFTGGWTLGASVHPQIPMTSLGLALNVANLALNVTNLAMQETYMLDYENCQPQRRYALN
jgi:hypothetical protein